MINNLFSLPQKITLKALPERSFLAPSKIHNLSVLITVEGTGDPSHNKIHQSSLIIVVDTSRSMRGDKLAMVKASLTYLLNNIESDCEITLIQFATIATICTYDPIRTDAKGIAMLKHIILNLEASGSTNLVAAVKFARTVAKHRRKYFDDVNILLFTDGHHDCESALLFDENELILFPVYTFSFGPDADASILIELSSKSISGLYQHINNIDEIPDLFGAKIDYLSAKLQSNYTVEIEAPVGTRVININGVNCRQREIIPCKKYRLNVGPIYAGDKKICLIRLSVRCLLNTESASDNQSILHVRSNSDNRLVTVSRAHGGQKTPTAEIANELIESKMYMIVKRSIANMTASAESGNLCDVQREVFDARDQILSHQIGGIADKYINELNYIYGQLIINSWYQTDFYPGKRTKDQLGRVYTTAPSPTVNNKTTPCIRSSYLNYC